MKFIVATFVVAFFSNSADAFVSPASVAVATPSLTLLAVADDVTAVVSDDAALLAERRDEQRRKQKQALFGLIGGGSDNNDVVYDPLLADPATKEPLAISVKGPILGGSSFNSVRLSLRSSADSERVFEGRTDEYINLLEPVDNKVYGDTDGNEKSSVSKSPILSSLLTFAPPPLRPLIANVNSDLEYIPMRDLFTSPSVSFAYERGWRQGFAAAGFPGADKEFDMARDYFAPVMEKRREMSGGCDKGTVVDMSCATGECSVVSVKFEQNNTFVY